MTASDPPMEARTEAPSLFDLDPPTLAAAPVAPVGHDADEAPPSRVPASRFDPTLPVAPGITMLEASAGTGKTHAVASIVVAEVARGRPVDELLVVTFTRKATGTLRSRVWSRLVEAARALDADAPGASDEPGADGHDDVLAWLRSGPAAEVAQRRRNLERAVTDFDAASITTTHGFCQRVLASLGVAGDVEGEWDVLEDVDDLVDEVVDDLLVRRFHDGAGDDEVLARDDARRIARAVVNNPDAELADAGDSPVGVLRRRFANTVCKKVEQRKRQARLLTYDDLLVRLDGSLRRDHTGEVVAARLRRQFRLAIVDEFQDTDRTQWSILARAFGSDPSRLVLVGDPKQAIYAFRGGDVATYLDAVAVADHHATLDTSWRADGPLLRALDAAFGGAQLGAEEIRHRPLQPRPGAEAARLTGDGAAPFTLRILEPPPGGSARRSWRLDDARPRIAADVARVAVEMLTGGALVTETDLGGAALTAGRPLGPGDIAVLVKTHREAARIRDALRDAGLPAVVHGGENVFATPAASAWLDVLRAIEAPARPTAMSAVAIGPFFEWDAARLAEADDLAWEEVHGRIHEWSVSLRRHGIAALWDRADADQGMTARLLGQQGGDRLLSDLRHLVELLDAAHPSREVSVATRAGWLEGEMLAAAARRGDPEGARRRLESDDDAVAIHTVHGAKGLEFPVVLLPWLGEGSWTHDDELPIFHDDERRRRVGILPKDVRPLGEDQWYFADEERHDEELRLLYVALTRARHRVVGWWASSAGSERSAFGRILLGREPDGAVPRLLRRGASAGDVRQAMEQVALTAMADAGPPYAPVVAVASVPDDPPPRRDGAPAPTDSLVVARFDRSLDRRWVRTSYSSLTAAAHDAGAGIGGAGEGEEAVADADPVDPVDPAEVDEILKVDEPAVADTDPTSRSGSASGSASDSASDSAMADALGATLPLGTLPSGPRFGTMVHEVLEHVDFAADDLDAAVRAAADAAGASRLAEGRTDELVTGLATALRTPLGPTFGERTLAGLEATDRLDELAFDLPLAGGDTPTGVVTMPAIARAFASLPTDDPLAGYHERLDDPLLAATVCGYLTGSIDLVARLDGRFVIMDYKTNLLAPVGEVLLARHFRPEALAAGMQDAHYPLQAALYSVALHRYLRWRLRGYHPDSHLGGVAYLFLRGMTGPEVARIDGHPCGVFAWHPPASFVVALSQVLEGGDG